MAWYNDIYKLWTYASKSDPYSAQFKDPEGGGVSQQSAIPYVKEGLWNSKDKNQLFPIGGRQSYNLLNLANFSQERINRYKEYEHLLKVPEINTGMTVFADEACVLGSTKIATIMGFYTIEYLAKNHADDRFLVYCYDFEKKDYTLGWAFKPRLVKNAPCIKIMLDNGLSEYTTPDHKFLLRNGEWIQAGDLKYGDELMPYYREPKLDRLNPLKYKQFPRIFTFNDGWKHERQFLDEWRNNEKDEYYRNVNSVSRMLINGLESEDILKATRWNNKKLTKILEQEGYTYKELRFLGKKRDKRTVIDVIEHINPHSKQLSYPVYDISVEKHQNFATDSCILHNCQMGENNHIYDVMVKDQEIQKEAMEKLEEWGIDRKSWAWFKNLCVKGDHFWEMIVDPEHMSKGIVKIKSLPAETMCRIENVKGTLLEFQQTSTGMPDLGLIGNPDGAADSSVIRFTPRQIVHARMNEEERNIFYPYGISLIEPAKTPAYMLKLAEDYMLVYRLCLVGNTRIRTTNGYKYIKDIRKNDEVYSLTKDNQLIPTTIVNQVSNGVKDVYTIKSKHISITGTATHPILVNRDGVIQYVDIQDLQIKKDKLIPKKNPFGESIKIPRIIGEKWAKLSDNQKLYFRNKQYKNKSNLLRSCYDFDRAKQFLYASGKALPYEKAYNICEIFGIPTEELIILNKGEINSERVSLPDYVDEEFARLFGFICGDGTVRDNSISFCNSNDEEVNRYYCSLLEKYFGKVVFEDDKRTIYGGRYIVHSTLASKIFKEMGYIHNHHHTRIPVWVFQSHLNIRRAFIEGLSDADGCERHTNKGTWFSTIELCNKKLIEDIKELWSSMGLCSGHISKRIRKNEHEIEPGRKLPKTKSYIITISELFLPEYENVLSVEYAGKREVYDITVQAEEHNFIANGIPVHNTRAPERRVYYIDMGNITGTKAENYMRRMQDGLKKKKVFNGRGENSLSSIDEKWAPPTVDEDIWVPTRAGNNTRIDTLPGACLDLNTRIPLLDGRILTLTDIISEYNDGKINWAYSCNPKDGSFAPGEITWAGITRKNTEVCKITFDNGETLTCTPDHKFPVIGKGKTQAKDLQIGESLIAFNSRKHRLRSSHKHEYTQVYDNVNKKWKFAHREVAEYLRSKDITPIKIYKEEYIIGEKFGTVHHINFNKFDNNPNNLVWMTWTDHMLFHQELPRTDKCRKGISNGLKAYHANLSQEDKAKRNAILMERCKSGMIALTEKMKDPNYITWHSKKVSDTWAYHRENNTEKYQKRSENTSRINRELWQKEEYRRKVLVPQTMVFPKSIMDYLISLFAQGMTISKALNTFNQNQEMINIFKESNQHLRRKKVVIDELKIHHVQKMVKHFGYDGIRHARRESLQYNHKVISIEFLDVKMDTGTITIDGKEELHNHHTFAICLSEHNDEISGIYTYNSNLDQVGDIQYLRARVYVALHFPMNYLNQEGGVQTRLTYASQDAGFAKFIERIQLPYAISLEEMLKTHFLLRGYPSDTYKDLKVLMTKPSPYRELSIGDVLEAKVNRAIALKGSGLYDDFTILTKMLGHHEEEAKAIISRTTAQKTDDLKMQIMAQDPALLGLGNQPPGGEELGVDAGGANPMLEPPPPEDEAPMPDQNMEAPPEEIDGQYLPEPNEDDIKRYNMDIKSYTGEINHEEVDDLQVD